MNTRLQTASLLQPSRRWSESLFQRQWKTFFAGRINVVAKGFKPNKRERCLEAQLLCSAHTVSLSLICSGIWVQAIKTFGGLVAVIAA